MREEHMHLCGVLPGHMLKIQNSLQGKQWLSSRAFSNVCQFLVRWGSMRSPHGKGLKTLAAPVVDAKKWRTPPPSSEAQVGRSEHEGLVTQSFQGDCRDIRMYTKAALVVFWVIALAGILVSAYLEWIWNFGP